MFETPWPLLIANRNYGPQQVFGTMKASDRGPFTLPVGLAFIPTYPQTCVLLVSILDPIIQVGISIHGACAATLPGTSSMKVGHSMDSMVWFDLDPIRHWTYCVTHTHARARTASYLPT